MKHKAQKVKMTKNKSRGVFKCFRFHVSGFMKQGVTLIEILVVITIFSIFITSVVSLFASAMKEQRMAMDRAYLLNQGSFVAEYVARALRMAQKDVTGTCIAPGFNYQITRGGDGIKFLNYRETNNCQEFYVENKVLKVVKAGVVQGLTPSGLSVEVLQFHISGQDQDDGLQGKVTFTWEFQSAGIGPQALSLQTTVSQRELDVKY